MSIQKYLVGARSVRQSHALKLCEVDGLDSVLVLATILSAFLGNRLLEKITIRFVQTLLAVMLFLIARGLGTGLI